MSAGLIASPNITNAMNSIVSAIPLGQLFDAHTVIAVLVSDYSVEYAAFRGAYSMTATAHGDLAKILKTIPGCARHERSPGDAWQVWSKNVNDNLSENSVWERI
jgi:hypothetical protein